jgi:hypothetical protein
VKLQSSVPIALQLARRQEVSAQTRFLDFPWGTNVGWPLREAGVFSTGIDYLDGHYLGGTAASATHLLYFIFKGKVECDCGEGF